MHIMETSKKSMALPEWAYEQLARSAVSCIDPDSLKWGGDAPHDEARFDVEEEIEVGAAACGSCWAAR